MIEAEESGRVIELYADRGDEVRRGGAIVKIDDTILRTQVDEARLCIKPGDPDLGAT